MKKPSNPLRLLGFFLRNGARGRIRTTDTAIFSRMLYQLSYPGIRCSKGPDGPASGWKRAYGVVVRAWQGGNQFSFAISSGDAGGPGTA